MAFRFPRSAETAQEGGQIRFRTKPVILLPGQAVQDGSRPRGRPRPRQLRPEAAADASGGVEGPAVVAARSPQEDEPLQVRQECHGGPARV